MLTAGLIGLKFWTWGGIGARQIEPKINFLKIAIFKRAKIGKFGSIFRFSNVGGLSGAERRGEFSRGDDFFLKNNYGGEKGVKSPFSQSACVAGLVGVEFRADCCRGVKSDYFFSFIP